MTDRHSGLLGKLSNEVFDESIAVTELLQMCVTLGTQTGSVNLRNWAVKELRGYEDRDKPPMFRQILPASVMASLEFKDLSGDVRAIEIPLSASNLSPLASIGRDYVDIGRIPIRELEDRAATGPMRVHIDEEPESIRRLQAELNRDSDSTAVPTVRAIYKKVDQGSLSRVVYQLRVSLAELLSEMAMNTPEDQETPTKTIVDRAMRVVVSGKGNTVTLINSHGQSGSNSVSVPMFSTPDSWWQRLRKRGLIVGLSTFLAAVTGVAVWLEWTPWK